MYQRYADGWLETISGCMFAGKTEELIRRVKVLEFANKKIQVFKPVIDNRYSNTKVVSHAGSNVESIVVSKSQEILELTKEDTEVVMVAGLDTDFRGEPFGPMPKLMAEAEFVTKLTAVCNKCGAPATRTQRIINGKPAKYKDPIVLVGASESYEARCRKCHEVVGKPEPEVY